jgi:hypothetical protein
MQKDASDEMHTINMLACKVDGHDWLDGLEYK